MVIFLEFSEFSKRCRYDRIVTRITTGIFGDFSGLFSQVVKCFFETDFLGVCVVVICVYRTLCVLFAAVAADGCIVGVRASRSWS